MGPLPGYIPDVTQPPLHQLTAAADPYYDPAQGQYIQRQEPEVVGPQVVGPQVVGPRSLP